MSRLNKKSTKQKKAYVHVHPVPENNKETQLLGFTEFIPYILSSFPYVLQVLCCNKAHRR